MNLLFSYTWFPSWMGIRNEFDFCAMIFITVFILFIYCIIGGICVPHFIKNHTIRILIALIWPLVLVIGFIMIPIVALYEFSKPKELQEKELQEWMKENK